jgi:hypothetical protein
MITGPRRSATLGVPGLCLSIVHSHKRIGYNGQLARLRRCGDKRRLCSTRGPRGLVGDTIRASVSRETSRGWVDVLVASGAVDLRVSTPYRTITIADSLIRPITRV